jgi:membrane-associated phospholipid phosphatase
VVKAVGMGTPDIIAIGYFGYVVVASAAVRGVPARRRAAVAGLAIGAIAAVVATTRLWPEAGALRNCLPAVWLVLGYWLPGGLLREPMPVLEAWLRASDRWLLDPGPGGAADANNAVPARRWVSAPPAWLSTLFEVAYGLVHPFVAAGLLVVVLTGHDASLHFWTPVLLAGYACYGTLPWLQARPPRVVEACPSNAAAVTTEAIGRAPMTRVRAWNERLLDRVSVHANTFPSGHVAVAIVVALAVADLAPAAGLFFVPFALLIAAATVVRRYHYTADVIFGVLVAIACWAATRLAAG